MDDLLWSMNQQSIRLLELRRDTNRVWDDQAAREIARRYLEPLAADDERLRAELTQLQEELDHAVTYLDAAREAGHEVGRCGEFVAERYQNAERDLHHAYGQFDIHLRCHASARERFPLVQNLISDTNNACGQTQGDR